MWYPKSPQEDKILVLIGEPIFKFGHPITPGTAMSMLWLSRLPEGGWVHKSFERSP